MHACHSTSCFVAEILLHASDPSSTTIAATPLKPRPLAFGALVLACQFQRHQRGALGMSGGFEMPHQTSKRKKQGFGGGKAKKPAQQGKTLTTGEAVARHMLLEYNAIKADGGKVARVHARLKDTDEWFPVGNVSLGRSSVSDKRRPLFLVLRFEAFCSSSRLGSLHQAPSTRNK